MLTPLIVPPWFGKWVQCNMLYARLKKRNVLWEHVRPASGGVHSICPFNSLNSCIIIKLCENVWWQYISAKFDNQPDPMKHFGVMALELAKIAKINRVRSVTWIFFQWIIIKLYDIVCWHNLLAKFNNQPDPWKDFGSYGPWISQNCPN